MRRSGVVRLGLLGLAAIVAGGAPAGAEEHGKAQEGRVMRVRARYYQQFDADFKRDVPAEGYGGWKQGDIEISPEHTAVVVMHAWDCGTREEYPGWFRSVEYIPRSYAISQKVFPKLLGAVRASGFKLFHVVGGGDYYKKYPGYQRAVKLAGEAPPPLEQAKPDPVLQRLHEFRSQRIFVGPHNAADVNRGAAKLDFAKEARPLGDEGIAENAEQLFALCKEAGVNHLVYAGFAINWCLLMSPGGMLDMSRRGVMSSAFRDAVTAVENRESARRERNKEEGLWRTSLSFGFVFDTDNFVKALPKRR